MERPTIQNTARLIGKMHEETGRSLLNERDCQFVKALEATPHDDWSPIVLDAAYRMLKRYAPTLKARGVEYADIRLPLDEFVIRRSHRQLRQDRWVEYSGGLFRVHFGRDPRLIHELSTNVPHTWRAKDEDGESATTTWYAPAYRSDTLNALGTFLTRHDFRCVEVVAAEHIERDKRRRASRATDAVISIPRLKGPDGAELFPYQRAGVAFAARAKRVYIADQMGLGKASPLDHPILTPTGWKPIGQIRVGDLVMGSDGEPRSVTGVYPQGRLPVFRCVFSDGAEVVCCDEHLWQVNTPERKWRGASPRVLPLSQIRARLRDTSGNRLHFTPVMPACRFADGPALPVPPYLLGAIAGDGCVSGGRSVEFACEDPETVERLRVLLPASVDARGSDGVHWRLTQLEGATTPNPLTQALRDLGVMGCRSETWFLPKQYLFASIPDRLELLRGLMDADGYVNKDGSAVQYYTTSPRLADDVTHLVRSLGGIAKRADPKRTHYVKEGVRHDGNHPVHILTIALPNGIVPFHVQRKVDRLVFREKYEPTRAFDRVEPAGEAECVCIAVDAPDRLYVTRDFVVTHNTMQALGYLEATNAYPACIVTPASLKDTWAEKIAGAPGVKGWLDHRKIQVVESGKDDIDPTADIIVVNYDLLKTEEVEAPPDPDEAKSGDKKRKKKRGPRVLVGVAARIRARNIRALVCDEAHYVKNRDAERTRAVRGVARGLEYICLLSGTPSKSRPEELIAQIEILGYLESEFGGLYGFGFRYCEAKKIMGRWSLKGAINIPELRDRMRSTFMIRRLKNEVLKELPDVMHTRVPLPINNMAEYQKASADFVKWTEENLGTEAAQKAKKAETLMRINALMALAAKGKMPAALDWIKRFTDEHEKLVAFAHHIPVQKAIADAFPGSVAIRGGDPKGAKAAVDAFQTDPKVPLIVCSILAGGVGHTLTASSQVAFVEYAWTPGEMDQCVARVDRYGQTASKLNAYYLVAKGTIEEEVEQMLASKRAIVSAITDENAKAVVMNTSIENDLFARYAKKAAIAP